MPVPKYVCTSCCYKDKPFKYKRGNRKLEIVLWICFLMPGIIYTLWRNSTAIMVCPRCETATMISTQTPHGQRLIGA